MGEGLARAFEAAERPLDPSGGGFASLAAQARCGDEQLIAANCEDMRRAWRVGQQVLVAGPRGGDLQVRGRGRAKFEVVRGV